MKNIFVKNSLFWTKDFVKFGWIWPGVFEQRETVYNYFPFPENDLSRILQLCITWMSFIFFQKTESHFQSWGERFRKSPNFFNDKKRKGLKSLTPHSINQKLNLDCLTIFDLQTPFPTKFTSKTKSFSQLFTKQRKSLKCFTERKRNH